MDRLTSILVRLAAAFPRDHVPESSIALYWDKLQNCELDALEKSVEMLIDNSQKFPTVAEIRGVYNNERERQIQQMRQAHNSLPLGRTPMPAYVKEQLENLRGKTEGRAAE